MGIKNEKGVWYHQTIYTCPVCGKATVYRERRPEPKPENPDEWYEHHDDNSCASDDVAWG